MDTRIYTHAVWLSRALPCPLYLPGSLTTSGRNKADLCPLASGLSSHTPYPEGGAV